MKRQKENKNGRNQTRINNPHQEEGWAEEIVKEFRKVVDNQQGPTWNPAQCYVAAWMGGEFRGEWIHVYVWLSPFTIHLKLSQHCLLIGFTPIQNKKKESTTLMPSI